jgi:hypothetical protein
MQHHLVVPLVFVVLMMYPVNKGPVDFHIAAVRDATYLDHGVPYIGSAIEIQLSCVKNAQCAPVNGVQLFVTEVLSVPNMTEKALVYVERARTHGLTSEKNKIQRSEDSVLREL